jgi:type III restriction enzyme
MSDLFFDRPIINSPYEYPRQHWELDDSGQPTGTLIPARRRAKFLVPIPKPKKRRAEQKELLYEDAAGLSTEAQAYDPTPIINELRVRVDRWRELRDPRDWRVSPTTTRLLQHWRNHEFASLRPFFCQIEAVEVAIWLTEVAPEMGREGRIFLEHLANANEGANPDLSRLALKLATGAGKTTVMAMLIAWQTINAVRSPNSRRFTRGFLVVTPGLTIKDRLRVLQPNDPDSYYRSRELVPNDMVADLDRAKIVITNYHAFKLRETVQLSKGGRLLLQGRGGEELSTLESEGQMLQRVMPELMGIKNILALNDEAHHCYREKPSDDSSEGDLKGDDLDEAKKNTEAARLWIGGLEAVQRKLGLRHVIDLSATPFFLRGSGYAEGTLFPWTMSDFSLMDAIECGIVKLPRVPIADNVTGETMPVYRNLWEHIRKDMPKKGRGKSKQLDPEQLPTKLLNALEALYGHYEKTVALWREAGTSVDPCFIVVCNNTSTSKLIYDFLAGYEYEDDAGMTGFKKGRHELFRNFDDNGTPIPRMRTLLIDSEQLDSGDALDPKFRAAAGPEIERFRRELKERGEHQRAENLSDQDLLREVMNTVGKKGRLGESIRCVVSVSMLTEGWDANTVTHILGVRAFGTQLLCEQVIGRALRRQSYELGPDGLFPVEYADVLGIPFDFTAKPQPAKPQPPRETVHVRALGERQDLEIRFPRVMGYRVELPNQRLSANFTADSTFELTPDVVGPSKSVNSGIIGETAVLDLAHTADTRYSTIVYKLAFRLAEKWRDDEGDARQNLFNELKKVARQWLDQHLVCKGGTYPAQILYPSLLDQACDRIIAAIVSEYDKERPIKALLDPYNPVGSSRHVNFFSSVKTRWETRVDRCHVNWAICHSDWEAEFCRVVEEHPQVRAYVKNQGLGFEVPYRHGGEVRHYQPDFIVRVDDGRGDDDPLHLVVEIKGYRGEDAKDKAETMKTYWVPGVNNLGSFGRWDFLELKDIWEIEDGFGKRLTELLDHAASGATR